MNSADLDKLLKGMLALPPATENLEQLEQDVWQGITTTGRTRHRFRIKKILSILSMAHFQIPAITLSMIIAIGIGAVMPSSGPHMPSIGDVTHLNFLTVRSPFLLTHKFLRD